MEEEQVFTIPLRDACKTQRKGRAAEAVKLVKQFIKKHLDVNEVRVSSDLNQKIWKKGAENPPRRIRARATKPTEDVAEVFSLE